MFSISDLWHKGENYSYIVEDLSRVLNVDLGEFKTASVAVFRWANGARESWRCQERYVGSKSVLVLEWDKRSSLIDNVTS